MTGYQRFVAYVYEYRKGKKGNNCGFVKVESRDGKCRMEVHLKCEGLTPDMECKIYGFVQRRGEMAGILLGVCQTQQDRAECFLETDADNLHGSKVSLKELGGMVLLIEGGGFYGTQWDEKPIRPENFVEMHPEKGMVPEKQEEKMDSAVQNEPPSRQPVSWPEPEASAGSETPQEEPSGQDLNKERTQPQTAEEVQDTHMAEQPEEGEEVHPSQDKVKEEVPSLDQEESDEMETRVSQQIKRDKAHVESGTEQDFTSPRPASANPASIQAASEEVYCNAEHGMNQSTEPDSQNEQEPKDTPQDISPMVQESIPQPGSEPTAESQAEIEEQSSFAFQEGVQCEQQSPPVSEEVSQNEKQSPSAPEPASQSEKQSPPAPEPASQSEKQSPSAPEPASQSEKQSSPAPESVSQREEQSPPAPEPASQLENQNSPASEPAIQREQQSPSASQSSTQWEQQNSPDSQETSQPELQGTSVEESETQPVQEQIPQINTGFDPFEDGEIIQCRKMDRRDFSFLNRRDWALRNNRFLLYGFYHFGHIIVGRLRDGQYILGVPGLYDQQERFMANMFGFPHFKYSPYIELPQGKGGYWYRLIYPPNLR